MAAMLFARSAIASTGHPREADQGTPEYIEILAQHYLAILAIIPGERRRTYDVRAAWLRRPVAFGPVRLA
jgi:hypothetical protein